MKRKLEHRAMKEIGGKYGEEYVRDRRKGDV